MTKSPKISIIDYGVGNLHSLAKAVQNFTSNVRVTDDAGEISSSDALILPGVGAFAAGMEGLEVRGLTQAVKNFAASGKPILGICLGAQIMLEKGFEFGEFAGLGLIGGQVVRFPELSEKIPQIGWNKISRGAGQNWNDSILKDLPPDPDVYFVHSYILEPQNPENALAMSEYGGQKFCAAIQKGKIFGCQFHPEKSGSVGLKIIENFIKLI